jgi:RNA polymerase sigma-70 factor (ECF subfamily)
MEADLSLAFADFATAFSEDAERALCELQALILDEASCLARIEYLRALAEKVTPAPLRFPAGWSAAAFSGEIELLSMVGLFPAWRDGRLRADRLVALASDPNALWQAHQALTNLDRPVEKVAPAAGLTAAERSPQPAPRLAPSSAGSQLAQIAMSWSMVLQAQAGGRDEVIATLQRYSPAIYRYLLARLGGDTHAAEDLCQEFLLRFVSGRHHAAHPEPGRLRDLFKAELQHLLIDYNRQHSRMPDQALSRADPADAADADRQFLETWRADLLNRTWDAVAGEERKTGRLVFTVLQFRANNPDLRSAQIAEELSKKQGKEYTGDWVRKWLHVARDRFAELLLHEVIASLPDPTPESVEEELIDLHLLEYCKEALLAWRERTTPPSP